MSQELTPGTVYVQDYRAGKASSLYTLDLTTGQATLVGAIASEVYDLAFVGSDLYGLSKRQGAGFRKSKTMKLLKIYPKTGNAETVGDTQFDVVGLACNPATQKLYATAHRDYQIVEINPKTGKGSPVVTLSDRDRLCGELTFNASGQAYISLVGSDLTKYLATCDMSTGQVNLIGDIGFPGLASMKFIGDTLYGVGGAYEGVGGENGQLIQIDTNTGAGRLVCLTDPALCWAGVTVLQSVEASAGAGADSGSDSTSGSEGGSRSSSSGGSSSSSSGGSSSSSSGGSSSSSSGDREVVGAGVGSGGGLMVNEETINFTFNFDESEIERAWQEIAAKVEASITTSGKIDANLEARRWDQLETWLLTGYKAQTKDLALQVARLELMMNTFKQQLESNLQLTFRRWSSHFDGRLESLVGKQITEVTLANLKVALEQLKVEVLSQTSQLIQTEIGKTSTQIIEAGRTEFNQSIEAQIASLRAEFTKSMEVYITDVRADLLKNFEAQMTDVRVDISKSVATQITDVRAEINQSIETQITNAKTEINQTIEAQTTNIDIEALINSEFSENIKVSIREDIDVEFSDLRTSISTLEKTFNTKIDGLRSDFRGEIVANILAQISQLIEEKIKLEMAKVDFNTYITEIDVRANKYLAQLSQLEVNLIERINQGDANLYNWVLEQLITLKGCITDRQALVEQLAFFSNELKTKLDTAPCVNADVFKPWTPLPAAEPRALPNAEAPQLPANS